jgi:hypothetical protein
LNVSFFLLDFCTPGGEKEKQTQEAGEEGAAENKVK